MAKAPMTINTIHDTPAGKGSSDVDIKQPPPEFYDENDRLLSGEQKIEAHSKYSRDDSSIRAGLPIDAHRLTCQVGANPGGNVRQGNL